MPEDLLWEMAAAEAAREAADEAAAQAEEDRRFPALASLRRFAREVARAHEAAFWAAEGSMA